MRILAIETSCDDTGISLLEIKGLIKPNFKVLSNVVSSQTIHQNYGGVFPMMAKREHQRNLLPVFIQALRESKLLNPNDQIPMTNGNLETIKKILEKESILFEQVIEFLQTHTKPKVDFIAVTNGPGLEPCLWVGVNFAKVISYVWDIPLIPVNHIEGHILVNLLNHKSYLINPKEIFPAISLIVSGGHTQLILVKKIGKYEIIGETRDDAAGECFDKCARVLGLGYPGGPQISALAAKISQTNAEKPQTNADIPRQSASSQRKSALELPRPMINSKDYDFSFSGLKTAVLYADQKVKNKNEAYIQNMCFEIQQSIIDVLIKKTLSAAKDFKAKTIILGGGVSANKELRKQLAEKIATQIPNTKYLIPDTALSTDNALMIAVTGYFNKNKKTSWKNLEADANLRVGE